ncbi:MAG: hypothetical protein AB1698_03465 [Pseudomonadota bacterium]
MLARAALRLAAIETLAPTAAIASGEGFPTLAGHRVYDSRGISSADLEMGTGATPSISVYTEDAEVERRGSASTSARGDANCSLVLVVELAELILDEAGNETTDAICSSDPFMKMILEALTAQARDALLRAPIGSAFRQIVKAVPAVKISEMSLPHYGVRFMRAVVVLSVDIPDDHFTDAAGLPEPLASVVAALPDGSYAKASLLQLAAAFRATTRDQLEAIGLTISGAPPEPFV